ncbi:MAG: hypothetical protein ACOCRK_07300 [bacterium]
MQNILLNKALKIINKYKGIIESDLKVKSSIMLLKNKLNIREVVN